MLAKQLGVCTVGGTLVGIALGLCPRLGVFSEVRNFQIFLLEMSYQGLSRVMPAGAMRAVGTAWGEFVVLGVIGGLIGLAIGMLASGPSSRVRRRWTVSPLGFSLGATVGVFVALFGILWCRIVLIHSSTSRMISLEGFGMVAGSIGIGLIVSLVVLSVLGWLARHRLEKAAVATGLLLLFVSSLSSSFMGSAGASNPAAPDVPAIQRVVLLGGDGATWDVALPMIRQGKLPHLASLMERGAWGDIRSTLPWKSPIIWTSIATGKREQAHGIHDFVVRDPQAQAVIPVSLASRKVKAIWDIAGEAGRRVNVINWYAGWPAEPVNGTMVSYRFLREELSDRIFPADRTEEIDRLVDGLDLAIDRELAASGAPPNETASAEVGLYLLERDQPDLYLLYLREIDHMQHFYWRYYAARRSSWLARWFYGSPDPAALAAHGRKIEDAYERLDAVLGKILKRAGPETAIVVVSDHGGGFKAPGQIHFTLNHVLEQLGALSRAAGERSIDWTKTQVYDATKRPYYEQRELFINRRPEGPLGERPSASAERALLESILARLTQLRTDTGKSVVTKARIRTSREGDLSLVARVNVRLEEQEIVRGSGIELPVSKILRRTELSGTHRLPGLLVMAGPGIKSGSRIRAASVLDVTPTLLYLLDLPVAKDMEGRVLLEAIEPAMRKGKPLRQVATYETGLARAAQPATSSVADEELLEQLRSLGYIQ